jgi:hypothetical protein
MQGLLGDGGAAIIGFLQSILAVRLPMAPNLPGSIEGG